MKGIALTYYQSQLLNIIEINNEKLNMYFKLSNLSSYATNFAAVDMFLSPFIDLLVKIIYKIQKSTNNLKVALREKVIYIFGTEKDIGILECLLYV